MALFDEALYDEALYDDAAATPPVPPTPSAGQSITVLEIYNLVCFALLEDYRLQLGILTDAQFLNYLAEAVLAFAQAAGLVKRLFTQQIKSGISQYTVPNDILQIQACFVGGVYIARTTMEELYNSQYEWPNDVGTPQAWFEDGLPTKTIQLWPIPDFSGTEIEGDEALIGVYDDFLPAQRNLTIVGAKGPSATTYTLSLADTVSNVVPAGFSQYLVYSILSRVFSVDGESKDTQRAHYCNARWLEGLALARAIRGEIIEEKR